MPQKYQIFTNTTATSGNTCAASPQACINAQSNISNNKFALESYPANEQLTNMVPSTCKKRSIHDVYDLYNNQISTNGHKALHDQFVKLNENFPLDTNSVLRELVKYIIGTYKSKTNQLQPTENQYLLLQCVTKKYCMINLHGLSNREWLDIINDDDILMSIVEQDTKADLKNRANAIVNALINSGEKHVTLLDGHGRMVYQILCELSNRISDVNEYTFTLYDLDSSITDWHNIFLPSSVESIWDNILYTCENKLREIKGVLYLNYCGIGSFCNPTLDMINKFAAKRSPIMVSYSLRGMSSQRKTDFWYFQKSANNKTKKPDKNGLCSELVSAHGKGSNKFLTYVWYLEGNNHFNNAK